MPRVVPTAATVASPGRSWRVVNGAGSAQANARRRTGRPWPSSSASRHGRGGAPGAKVSAANRALTSAWAFRRSRAGRRARPGSVARGDTVRQGEGALQPLPLAAAAGGDVLEALRLARDGARRDRRDA